jgi:hypothetical protein
MKIFWLTLLAGCGGAAASFHPGSHAPLPQIEKGNGPVLSTPRFTAITFAGDPLAPDLEKFLATIGGSNYWKSATSEYGVGAASATDPIRIADAAPAMIDDDGIRAWLTTQLSAGLPAPDDQSLYVIFYPESSAVTERNMNKLCSGSSGYHSSFQLAGGQKVAYAVLGRCASSTHLTLQNVTRVTSHELAEAATDPYIGITPAYLQPRLTDYAWTHTNSGGEVGDLCEHDASSDYFDAELGYEVQRIWSNAAAAAGGDPCVPRADGDIYFGATPMVSDTMVLNFNTPSSKPIAATGVQILIGHSKTIPLELFTQQPMGAIDVWADEYPIDPTVQQPGDLSFSVDRASGDNGATLQLTITVNSDQYGEGHEYFVVYAQSGDVQHRWPVVVGN